MPAQGCCKVHRGTQNKVLDNNRQKKMLMLMTNSLFTLADVAVVKSGDALQESCSSVSNSCLALEPAALDGTEAITRSVESDVQAMSLQVPNNLGQKQSSPWVQSGADIPSCHANMTSTNIQRFIAYREPCRSTLFGSVRQVTGKLKSSASQSALLWCPCAAAATLSMVASQLSSSRHWTTASLPSDRHMAMACTWHASPQYACSMAP